MQRLCSGMSGRIENRQISVFLAYAGSRGSTLLDRKMYLPQVRAEDWERQWVSCVSEIGSSRTKPQPARLMLGRALEWGVPCGRVAGDQVCGNDRSDRNLWLCLERKGSFLTHESLR